MLQGLSKNDKKVSCPCCDYFEVWDINDYSNLFYCKNEKCWKCTCLVHNQSFNYPKDVANLTCKEIEEMNKGNRPAAHFRCVEYKVYVDTIIEICEKLNQRFCPNCGTGGRKDSSCTHITCLKCYNQFCYFCCISFDKADKSDPNGGMSCHNDTNIFKLSI